jgi:hypothetical protein
MQPEHKPLSLLTREEKQLRKLEQQADGRKAAREYKAQQFGKLENMHRLRALRLSRDKVLG